MLQLNQLDWLSDNCDSVHTVVVEQTLGKSTVSVQAVAQFCMMGGWVFGGGESVVLVFRSATWWNAQWWCSHFFVLPFLTEAHCNSSLPRVENARLSTTAVNQMSGQVAFTWTCSTGRVFSDESSSKSLTCDCDTTELYLGDECSFKTSGLWIY